jgi:hypothetical protein
MSFEHRNRLTREHRRRHGGEKTWGPLRLLARPRHVQGRDVDRIRAQGKRTDRHPGRWRSGRRVGERAAGSAPGGELHRVQLRPARPGRQRGYRALRRGTRDRGHRSADLRGRRIGAPVRHLVRWRSRARGRGGGLGDRQARGLRRALQRGRRWHSAGGHTWTSSDYCSPRNVAATHSSSSCGWRAHQGRTSPERGARRSGPGWRPLPTPSPTTPPAWETARHPPTA